MPAVSNLSVHFSSKSSEWETPQDLFDELNKQYGPLEFDVCTSGTNSKCLSFATKEGLWVDKEGPFYGDGLTSAWHMVKNGRCWMNPPYGREIGKWVRKAYEESQKGAVVVCLLPARTDTKWFHDYCLKGKVTFLKGRLKFGKAKNSAPFPSMVVVFG